MSDKAGSDNYLERLNKLNERYELLSKKIAQLEGAEKEIKRNLERVSSEAERLFGTSDLDSLRQMAMELKRQIDEEVSVIEHEISEIENMISEAERIIDGATSSGAGNVF